MAGKRQARIKWAIIPCPKCGETFKRVNAEAVVNYEATGAKHVCGFSGTIKWINPKLTGRKGGIVTLKKNGRSFYKPGKIHLLSRSAC